MRKLKEWLKEDVVPQRVHPKAFFARWIYRRCHGKVRTGPFQGMRYVRHSVGSALCPKLLGLYERELAPLVEQLAAESFPAIIDVGAAEGYYAVGLALRSPTSVIVAFESTNEGQQLMRAMAQLNEVTDRIEIHGHCEQRDLVEITQRFPSGLIIMDAEGAEADLLDANLIPYLGRFHLLIELHEFISRTIPALVRERFENTHSLTEIWTTDRSLDDLPFKLTLLRRFFKKWLSIQITDERPEPMRWFYLRPKGAS
jgi:hypothetical protein